MNKKDVEAYQKSYEEIDIFLKQFPYFRHVVVGELKTKSGKGLFKNSLSAKYDELEHLKANMNNYLGKNTTEKKKSVISEINRHRVEGKEEPKERKEVSKEVEI